MKLYLSIGVLCALTVGLICLRGCSSGDGEAAISQQQEAPVELERNITDDEALVQDSALAKWVPPPTANTTPLPSLQPLGSQKTNASDESLATSPLPPLSPTKWQPPARHSEQQIAASARPLSPTHQGFVIEPLPPLTSTPGESSLVRQVSFSSPVVQQVTPEPPTTFFDDLRVHSTPLPSSSENSNGTTSVFGGTEEDANREPGDKPFDSLDDDDSQEFANDDDSDDSDDPPTDFNTSAEPPVVPNETEQIAVILDQIGNHRITGAAHELRWSLDDAIMASLVHSNRVNSLRIESTEALQNVGVEYGQFDVAAFVQQSFRDSAEPVGSSIDTASGVQPIVNEDDLNIEYGLRQQLRSGGDFEISQSYQFLDNDSGILVPTDQAISRLTGRITKEVLRGAGRSIAMNQVLVAHFDASAQRSESVANIADHLNEVMTAYWDIYAARGALFAAIENRQMAIEVRRELNARRDIDAEPNLIDQSEATIRQRALQINQAHSDLVKAQIQFISLVNAPELLNNSNNIEILPQVTPDLDHRDLDIASRVNTAIQRRPEIGDIIEQVKSAQVTNHLSLNELLPQLSLSLEASLNGLEGDNDLGSALGNQFENDLTYQVGLDFEVPLANRRARFNRRRTELAVARLWADWQTLIEQVKADVLDNAQEFTATQTRLETQGEVLKFTANELRYLGLRKTVAPKESDNVSFALTQVLSAQDRQGEAKTDFIAAIADKHRAIFELNRATGILINSDVIPQDGGPARPGCFSVYHQFIEERGAFEGPLDFVEAQTLAKSRNYKQGTGVGRLNIGSCSCHSAQPQAVHAPCGPSCQSLESFEEVIHVEPVAPAVTVPHPDTYRYPRLSPDEAIGTFSVR